MGKSLSMQYHAPGTNSNNKYKQLASYRPGSYSRVTDFDRWMTRFLLSIIGNPAVTFVLWNNEKITSARNNKNPRLRINDRPALYWLVVNPELNFGNLYTEGRIEIEGDLRKFLDCIYRSIHYTEKNKLSRFLNFWQAQHPRSNTRDHSRQNIHHHYDLGNQFYEKWLDKEMQYTCAYFPDQALTLELAQIAKMHHVCRKLRLKPGQTVVEAGCGWGGLARFMAQHYGVKVKAYNISHQQIAYASQRAADAGLTDQVEYIEDDYRNIQGRYDAFVSIGMLEHVGLSNYRELGAVIDRTLLEHGMGLIHSIGRNQPGYLNSWIERNIFPGACPPSISQIMNIFEPLSFSVLDIENLRLHYMKTLEHWLSKFENNVNVPGNEYDESFIRAWRLYLTGSIAGFSAGTLQLFQIVFTRPENNDLTWSRAHLYNSHSEYSA